MLFIADIVDVDCCSTLALIYLLNVINPSIKFMFLFIKLLIITYSLKVIYIIILIVILNNDLIISNYI